MLRIRITIYEKNFLFYKEKHCVTLPVTAETNTGLGTKWKVEFPDDLVIQRNQKMAIEFYNEQKPR